MGKAELMDHLLHLTGIILSIEKFATLQYMTSRIQQWSCGSMDVNQCYRMAMACKCGAPVVAAYYLSTSDGTDPDRITLCSTIFWSNVLDNIEAAQLFEPELTILLSVLGNSVTDSKKMMMYKAYINAGSDWRSATIQRMNELLRNKVLNFEHART